jgi:hypothetical protein
LIDVRAVGVPTCTLQAGQFLDFESASSEYFLDLNDGVLKIAILSVGGEANSEKSNSR